MVHVPEFKYSNRSSCSGFDIDILYNNPQGLLYLDVYNVGVRFYTDGNLLCDGNQLDFLLRKRKCKKDDIPEFCHMEFRENSLEINQYSLFSLKQRYSLIISMLELMKENQSIENEGLSTKVKEIIEIYGTDFLKDKPEIVQNASRNMNVIYFYKKGQEWDISVLPFYRWK